MKYRNIAGETVSVPMLGSPGYPVTVEAGEEVDLPNHYEVPGPPDDDGQPTVERIPLIWPADLWERVKPPAAKPADKAKAKD